MTDRRNEFERSNAFVDQELDRSVRGEVLAAAAGDSRLAKELSDLNRLKSAVEDSIDVPQIDLPVLHGRKRWDYRAAMALAASLAFIAILGAGWWFIPSSAPGHGVPMAWAIESHKSWSDSAERPGGLFRPVNARLNAHVPDLSAAKLRVAHVGEGKTPDGLPALVVGYLGTRGCRVTLLIEPAHENLGDKAVKFEVGGLHGTVWQAGRLQHLILAEGMAEARFKLIAEAVRRSSLERLPIDDRTRVALADSRAKSLPCAA